MPGVRTLSVTFGCPRGDADSDRDLLLGGMTPTPADRKCHVSTL